MSFILYTFTVCEKLSVFRILVTAITLSLFALATKAKWTANEALEVKQCMYHSNGHLVCCSYFLPHNEVSFVCLIATLDDAQRTEIFMKPPFSSFHRKPLSRSWRSRFRNLLLRPATAAHCGTSGKFIPFRSSISQLKMWLNIMKAITCLTFCLDDKHKQHLWWNLIVCMHIFGSENVLCAYLSISLACLFDIKRWIVSLVL